MAEALESLTRDGVRTRPVPVGLRLAHTTVERIRDVLATALSGIDTGLRAYRSTRR
ncbi:hypothetical protein Srubr_27450 [Streptomyces rubradiris]|uniref:Uncharacterized protein n=1 Tax=Streptomyces rubradiris TaxID=285531 RepID=A0ABQ3RAM7_STRRR|nr:hypothetical protein Srubr_27450 [Streptomyces rubradiris]